MQQSAVENGTEQKDTRHQKDEDQHGRYLPTREDQAGGDARDRKNGAVRKIENAHDAIDQRQPEGDECVESTKEHAADQNLENDINGHKSST